MTNKYSAIDSVMGRLCEDLDRKVQGGKSRKSSRRGTPSNSTSRMSRVGGRHGKAIFKLVRTGGSKDRSGLKGQLNYIFRDDKVAAIIDPTERFEQGKPITNAKLNELTREWSNDWWKGTRNGQTTHMILSYPRGTSIEDVTAITKAVCNEKFNSGPARFNYVAAIHDDKESHPHAHVIVNRRASDKSLFNMREGTEYSYEGFREAMAAHAERRGIFLDPTSRFERGITDRQPTQTEQRAAQKEGRAPEQRPRTGADLAFAQQQVAFAQIGYQAMAVIAANADCPRLEQAYREISSLIATNEGEFIMPELSREEAEQFDQYAELLNETLEKTEKALTEKDATARVPYEVRLSETMTAFTALSPNARYAEGLHEKPMGNSIYMNEFEGQGPEWDSAKDRVVEFSDKYGLNGAAINARIEAGAQNQYLEQLWMQDDLRTVALASDLRIDDPQDRQTAVSELTNAYQEIREDLIRAQVMRPIPQAEAEIVNEPATRQLTSEETKDLERAFQNQDWQPARGSDEDHYNRVMEDINDLTASVEEFSEQSKAHASTASDLWDKYAVTPYLDKPKGYLPEDERERPNEFEQSRTNDGFDKWAERSPDRYSLTRTADDHQEVIRLLRDNTTTEEMERFRNGDLTAINHITTDPVFSRQLLAEQIDEDRADGRRIPDDLERELRENRDVLQEHFKADFERDREAENER